MEFDSVALEENADEKLETVPRSSMKRQRKGCGIVKSTSGTEVSFYGCSNF